MIIIIRSPAFNLLTRARCVRRYTSMIRVRRVYVRIEMRNVRRLCHWQRIAEQLLGKGVGNNGERLDRIHIECITTIL